MIRLAAGLAMLALVGCTGGTSDIVKYLAGDQNAICLSGGNAATGPITIARASPTGTTVEATAGGCKISSVVK